MEQEFSKILRDWYRKNGRNLPWRTTRDAYKIWLSEVILQQTRVDQGLPYYHRFTDTFPTILDLANAHEDQVLRLWQGLGYYSRARNLHAADKQVRDMFAGQFPRDYSSIRSLKGVGDYTAAAIASFAFDLPFAVVDGNVFRFLSRFTGDTTPIDSTSGKKHFSALAAELLDPQHPAEHNQAIMEFGALHCKPVNPLCETCPFQFACGALIENKVGQLPVKEKKQQVRDRWLHYFFVTNGEEVLLRKRTGRDIWQGLYEFPMTETDSEAASGSNEALLQQAGVHLSGARITGHDRLIHLLSHQRLHAVIRMVETGDLQQEGYLKVPLGRLHEYGLPQLLVKYLRKRGYQQQG